MPPTGLTMFEGEQPVSDNRRQHSGKLCSNAVTGNDRCGGGGSHLHWLTRFQTFVKARKTFQCVECRFLSGDTLCIKRGKHSRMDR